jgi:hypothetical protein
MDGVQLGAVPRQDEVADLTRDASTVGVATHRLIALCALLRRDPDYGLVDAVARRHVGRGLRPSARQALLMPCVTFAAVYFGRFHIADATLAAVEEQVDGARLDLLWRLPGRGLVADEIKTGRFVTPRVLERARAQAIGGRVSLGSRFAGVRIVRLRDGGDPTFVPAPDAWPA